MKLKFASTCLFLVTALAGCDMRSETAKREMEKFSGTPTPAAAPAPTEVPIDPSEVVQVDTSLQGDSVNVSGHDQKKSVACTKLNRVTVNGGRCVVTVKGPCRQLMVNGDGNQITIDAAMEIVVNGDRNIIQYAGYVNGKRPVITDNAGGNTIEKIAVPAARK